MDIRAMLNPSADVPEERSNFTARPFIQHTLESLTSNDNDNKCYLQQVKVDPSESTHSHTTLAFHLRGGDQSIPQSPPSHSYKQEAFTPFLNHCLPTPPPSSPPLLISSQQSHHPKINLATGASHSHHSRWTPTLSYPPRKRSGASEQYQDPYWNVPVEVNHIRISHRRSRGAISHRSTHGVSKAPKRKRLGPHSNKAYTLEQVQWMRYFSEDRGLTWPQVHAFFYQRWPGEVRDSVACITSRYYRSNLLPKLNANGLPMLDESGKFVMVSAKVRERATKEGKHKPFHFLDLHPEWALVYDWVQPEDKERALRLLKMLDGSIEDTEGKSEGTSPVNKVWSNGANIIVEFRNYQRAQRIVDGQNKDLVFRLSRLNL